MKCIQALANLGQEHREVIELAFFAGHTQMAISEKLGIPLGTTEARIRRGMKSLKPHLRPLRPSHPLLCSPT